VSRLPEVTEPKPEQREVLESTQRQLGRVPNLYRTMVNSPAALEGYLGFRQALGAGRLSPLLREQLALAVAEANACGYCVAAHTFRGRKAGLSEPELSANRVGESEDSKTAAALHFARRVIEARGRVLDEDLTEVRAAGWEDADIAELVAHVALNTFSNWFNHVAEPTLDFPAVR
jgi:uncharacterized peroxidase-related enzyme